MLRLMAGAVSALIAAATLTKHSTSSGTTSVTTKRGYDSLTGLGVWTGSAGITPTRFYATRTTGAITYAVRTFLTTSGDTKIDGRDSIVAVLKGVAATMTWVTTDPESGAAFNAYYVDGDPFGLHDNVTYPQPTDFDVVITA